MDGQATAIIPRDNATVLGLRNAGKTCQEIADLTGVHKATIARQLKHLTPRKATQIYRDMRADIAAELQRQILGKCDLRTVKITTAKELQSALTGWGILYDKERLERDQSTSNVSIHADIAALKTVDNSGRKPVDNLLSEEIP